MTPNRIFSAILVVAIFFSIASIVRATTPNPGHPWSETGNGDFAVTGATALRTYTLPDSDATIVTGHPFSQGGILYGSAASTTAVLPKDTNATRYLSNTGTSNNPAWAQVSMTSGVSGILSSTNGGTGNGFTQFSGPTTAEKTFTLPDASATVLTSNAAVTVAQGGTGLATLTANGILVGNGTGAPTFVTSTAIGSSPLWSGSAWEAASSTEYDSLRLVGATKDRWYTSPITGTALTTGAPTANVLRAIPFIVPKTITVDRIAINVTTLLTGNVRFGIYRDNGLGYPGSLVLDGGAVSTATAGVKSVAINQVLNGGQLYWLAIVSSAAATLRCFSVASMNPILGFDNTLGTAPGLFYSVAFTYAALPATFTAGATFGTAVPIPAIFVRVLN